jgi:geranylgeranylglycerol-phosphate geranylgeranyltransferase
MEKEYANLFSLTFWKAYWVTMRPYLLFISGSAGIAGFVEGPERGIVVTLGVFFAFFFSYGLGHGITDTFQMDTDSLSSPYRPLVRGIIRREHSLLVSLVLLVVCCAILFLLNPWILLLGLICVLGLVTYTYFKRRWWGGPFYNAWIVALLPIIGKLAATGSSASLPSIFEKGILLPVVISVFFSYANFVLMGYFKDISADRSSGYNTFVVVFGWKKAAVGSDVFALLSVFATGWGISSILLTEEAFSMRWLSVGVLLCAVIILFLAQVGIHRTRDENEAYRPIAYVVRGFILLRLAEICALRPSWIVLALLFYVAFEYMLKKRPEKKQV